MANTKLSEERIGQLKEAKQNIDMLSELVGGILDGKFSSAEIGRRLGLSPTAMQNNIKNSFLPRLHKLRALSDESLAEVLRMAATPYEKLFYAIFGISYKYHGFVFLSENTEGTLKETVSKCLTLQEQEILSKHYGLSGERPLTYKEIGEEYGFPQAKSKQIVGAAIRRLRHPDVWKKICPAYEICVKTEEKVDILAHRNEQLLERYKKAKDACSYLETENALLEKEIRSPEEENVLQDLLGQTISQAPLESLGVSPRLVHLLKLRGNCNTIGDVAALTAAEARCMHGMGVKSFQELKGALDKLGIGFSENPGKKVAAFIKSTLVVLERENGLYNGYVCKDGKASCVFETAGDALFGEIKQFTADGYMVKCLGKERERDFMESKKTWGKLVERI